MQRYCQLVADNVARSLSDAQEINQEYKWVVGKKLMSLEEPGVYNEL